MGERFKRLVGIGGPDADDLGILKARVAADNGPAEFSGGMVGKDEEPIMLAGLNGFGE